MAYSSIAEATPAMPKTLRSSLCSGRSESIKLIPVPVPDSWGSCRGPQRLSLARSSYFWNPGI
eukprot:16448836-Heterocapsa_arctica.AAC.1